MRYQFKAKDKDVSIYLSHAGNEISYCTIKVVDADKKVHLYHDGTVCCPNDADNFNIRTAYFIAFKRALRRRWDDVHRRNPEFVWKMYHKRWSHFLSALIDGKIDTNEQHYDPDSI